MVAVQTVLAVGSAGNAVVFSRYTLFAMGLEQSGFNVKLGAMALLVSVVIMHGCFLKTGIWIQNALAWVKIGITVFMILTGFAVLLQAHTGMRYDDATNAQDRPKAESISTWGSLWEGSIWDWGTIATAIFKVQFSYSGYSNVNNVLNEVQDPVRTLKTVAPAALFSVCAIYLFLNIAYFSVIPLEEVRNSGELIAALYFQKAFPGIGDSILPLLVSISTMGTVMVVMFSMVCHVVSSPARLLSSTTPHSFQHTFTLF